MGERHRLGRRARQERPRPPALALHRHHPGRAGPGHPCLRGRCHDRPQRRLVAAAARRPRRGQGAARRHGRRLVAGPLSAGAARARPADAALRRPLGPAAAEGGLVCPASRRALCRLGLRLLDRRARRPGRPDLSRHRAHRRRALRGGGPSRAHGPATSGAAAEARPHARGPPHSRRLSAARRQPGRDLSAQPRAVGPGLA